MVLFKRVLKNMFIILIYLSVFLLFEVNVFASENNLSEYNDLLYSDNEIIVILDHEKSVLFKEYSLNSFGDLNCIEIEDLTSSYKAKYLECKDKILFKSFRRILKLTLSTSSKAEILNSISTINEINGVYSAEPNFYMEIEEDNDNTMNMMRSITNNNEWAFESIELDECYEILPSNCEIVNVGVFDTGIYMENKVGNYYEFHEDFDGINVYFRNYVGNSIAIEDENDIEGHGTAVASIITAKRNNSIGIDGVTNNVNLYMYKIRGTEINTTESLFEEDALINAINDALEDNVSIINISFGFDFDSIIHKYYEEIQSIKQAFANFPGLIVCAAGNSNQNIDDTSKYIYPASYEFSNIITVGALSENNTKFSSSNYGDSHVDLFAPGENIYVATSPREENNYIYYKTDSGTSFAAPFVTGVAAILLSINTQLTPCMLKHIILSTVESNLSLENYCVTEGTLNAYNAVSYLLSVNDEVNANNLQHLYYGVDYYNDTYHVYRCYCNNTFYEAHNWVLLSPYAIIPGPIRQVCSVCGVEKFE